MWTNLKALWNDLPLFRGLSAFTLIGLLVLLAKLR